jgi:hypothetical protein
MLKRLGQVEKPRRRPSSDRCERQTECKRSSFRDRLSVILAKSSRLLVRESACVCHRHPCRALSLRPALVARPFVREHLSKVAPIDRPPVFRAPTDVLALIEYLIARCCFGMVCFLLGLWVGRFTAQKAVLWGLLGS